MKSIKSSAQSFGLHLVIAMTALMLGACPDGDGPGSDGGADSQVSDGADGGAIDAGPQDDTIEITVFDNARITSVGGDPNFQTITNNFDLGPGPYAQISLLVELDSTCYPFDEWTTPPEGHNWPADCDAFGYTVLVTTTGSHARYSVSRDQ